MHTANCILTLVQLPSFASLLLTALLFARKMSQRVLCRANKAACGLPCQVSVLHYMHPPPPSTTDRSQVTVQAIGQRGCWRILWHSDTCMHRSCSHLPCSLMQGFFCWSMGSSGDERPLSLSRRIYGSNADQSKQQSLKRWLGNWLTLYDHYERTE